MPLKKSKLQNAESIHNMVKSGMPAHLARAVTYRKPMPVKKKEKK